MRLQKIRWYKKVLPIFLIESESYFEKNVYHCVRTFGPVLLVREGSACTAKKRLGIKHAEQFYRSFIIGWVLNLVSFKARLLYEIAVAARYLKEYGGDATDQARYIWAEKGLRDYTTVDHIKAEIIKKQRA